MRYNRRLAQVNQVLREAVGQILIEHNSDPILAALTVTEVRVSSDLSHARVYLMCRRPGPGEENLATAENLNHAAEIVQKFLAPEIYLKKTPKLRFEIDDTEEKAERLEHLLEEVRQDWEDADGNTECQ